MKTERIKNRRTQFAPMGALDGFEFRFYLFVYYSC